MNAKIIIIAPKNLQPINIIGRESEKYIQNHSKSHPKNLQLIDIIGRESEKYIQNHSKSHQKNLQPINIIGRESEKYIQNHSKSHQKNPKTPKNTPKIFNFRLFCSAKLYKIMLISGENTKIYTIIVNYYNKHIYIY